MEGKLKEFLLPQEKVDFTQLYPFAQLDSPQSFQNPSAEACTKTWNWSLIQTLQPQK